MINTISEICSLQENVVLRAGEWLEPEYIIFSHQIKSNQAFLVLRAAMQSYRCNCS